MMGEAKEKRFEPISLVCIPGAILLIADVIFPVFCLHYSSIWFWSQVTGHDLARGPDHITGRGEEEKAMDTAWEVQAHEFGKCKTFDAFDCS
jgi:hypothetical protein